LADFTRFFFKNLYQNRLGGPIACHVLVQISRFLIFLLVEIRQVFALSLYIFFGWNFWTDIDDGSVNSWARQPFTAGIHYINATKAD